MHALTCAEAPGRHCESSAQSPARTARATSAAQATVSGTAGSRAPAWDLSTIPNSRPRTLFPEPNVLLSRLQSALGSNSIMLLYDPAACAAPPDCCSSCADGKSCESTSAGEAPDPISTAVSAIAGGSPLDADVRTLMEERYGHDFGDVRVHVGPAASSGATALGARAYTVGSDIVFGEGAYSPNSRDGLHVIAHELAHVVQQSSSAQMLRSDAVVSDPGDGSEIEAELAAANVVAGRNVTIVPGRAANAISRFTLVEQPAGGCGVCQGPQAAGNAAHDLIQMDFNSSHPLGLTEMHIAGPGGNGFLDLAIATPSGLQIGEIKPAHTAGYLAGESDMLFYLSAVTMAFPNTTVKPLDFTLSPWVSIFPNPVAGAACPAQSLYVNPPLNGIYGYYCSPTFVDLVKNPACRCTRQREPEPLPFAKRQEKKSEQSSAQRVKEFVESLVGAGAGAIEAAARQFLKDNPELIKFVTAMGVVAIIAMIVQDIATLGAGIADNPAIIAIVGVLTKVASEMEAALAM